MYAKYSKKMVLPFLTGQRIQGKTEKNRNQLKLYHHVWLDQEFKDDCKTWLTFLDNNQDLNEIVNHPMIDIFGPYS